MKLRAENSIQGIDQDGDYTLAGAVFELADAAEAQRLIDLGAAIEVVTEDNMPDTDDIFAIH